MNMEQQMLKVVEDKLKDGFVNKIVEEQLEKGINKAVEHLFSSYGDVTKVLEDKIKEVIIPYVESYDYSEYIVKLDDVMVSVLKETAVPHKKLVENFSKLMVSDVPETVTVEDIFIKWQELVAEEVDTDKLEVEYYDEPEYEAVEVQFSLEEEEKIWDWSSFTDINMQLQCERDTSLNREVRFDKYDHNEYMVIKHPGVESLRSLRNLDEFEVYLMTLAQNRTKVLIDDQWEGWEEVTPNKKPEADWS
ncbi:hypothetical protein CPT_Mater46 [Bacillus phage Mater]|uniref:Uncharacterized protein n=1 Tax=Bacillus phage Mater TaxID=1540090 RepID=A0A0A0RUG9_9CAUD|nr:hypothetical protein CPT_Mater46 [Bacillus phage Mater]AIW03203.1 hypothetical protein CPT_Mater46 [Bacillus phage Mater]